MTKLFLITLVFGGALNFSVLADDKPATFDKSEDPNWTDDARLSPAGLRRVQENNHILQKSLETTQENINHSSQNITTLDSKIGELTRLEDEINKLKIQYESFLVQAAQENQKNSEALASLNKITDRKLAQLEREDRERWQKNTAQQVNQVKGLLAKLKKDMSKISIQKQDLNSQKAHWTDREKFHQKILEDLKLKKVSAEKKLKGEG